MKLSEKHKKTILSIVLLVVTAIMFKFVYSPFFAKFKDLKDEIEVLEKKYNTLSEKASQSDKLIEQVNEMISEIDKTASALPPNLLQERVILVLKELQDSAGIVLNNITFSNSEVVEGLKFENEDEPPTEYMQEGNRLTGEKAKEPEKEDISPHPDNTVLKMEVRTSFNCSYQQLKNLLYAADVSSNKIVISNLSVSGGTDELSGNITLLFWGLVNKEKAFPDWDIELETGRHNLF